MTAKLSAHPAVASAVALRATHATIDIPVNVGQVIGERIPIDLSGHDVTAGLGHAHHFSQRSARIIEVLQHALDAAAIKRRVSERQLLRIPDAEVDREVQVYRAVAGDTDECSTQINANKPTRLPNERCDLAGEIPGTAADIEEVEPVLDAQEIHRATVTGPH